MNAILTSDLVSSPFPKSFEHNSICFDWFSFTKVRHGSYDYEIAAVKKLLGLSHVEWQNMSYVLSGTYYSNHISYLNVSIQWGHSSAVNNHFKSKDGTVFDTIHVSMSGAGCRTFEHCSKINWNQLFCILSSDPKLFNITRLDVAYDDFEGFIDFNYLRSFASSDKIDAEQCVTCFDTSIFECISNRRGEASVYFGSKSSDCFFRVYNKLLEQKFKFKKNKDYLDSLPEHWIRWEMVLRHENASGFVRTYLSTCKIGDLNSGDLGSVFKGVLLNHLRFVVPSKTESNKSRWKLQQWFAHFIGSVSKISIWSKQDPEYSIESSYRWFSSSCFNTAGNLMLYYSPFHLVQDVFEFLLSFENGLPPPKYLEALNSELQKLDKSIIRTPEEYQSFVHKEFDDALRLLTSEGVPF